jgi:hypothetical protein
MIFYSLSIKNPFFFSKENFNVKKKVRFLKIDDINKLGIIF